MQTVDPGRIESFHTGIRGGIQNYSRHLKSRDSNSLMVPNGTIFHVRNHVGIKGVLQSLLTVSRNGRNKRVVLRKRKREREREGKQPKGGG